MSLIDHAKREFLAAGYEPIETAGDDPNKWIQESVLELLEIFSNQEHSGSSAPYAIEFFRKLAAQEPLVPLSGEDQEWNECGNGYWQNNRCSHVFKSENGTAYDIDGYVFWHWGEMPTEEGDEGHPKMRKFKSCFTSNMSKKLITFPYTPPKPEYIEVECYEVNEHGEPEAGTGDWETIYPSKVIAQNALLEAAMKKGK